MMIDREYYLELIAHIEELKLRIKELEEKE
jgi:hypothetical protein